MLLVRRADLLAGYVPEGAEPVERGVTRYPQNPGCEGHLALLVLADHPNELGEHILSYVLRFVGVADDAQDVAIYVVRIPDIDEMERVPVALLGSGDGPRRKTLGV